MMESTFLWGSPRSVWHELWQARRKLRAESETYRLEQRASNTLLLYFMGAQAILLGMALLVGHII